MTSYLLYTPASAVRSRQQVINNTIIKIQYSIYNRRQEDPQESNIKISSIKISPRFWLAWALWLSEWSWLRAWLVARLWYVSIYRVSVSVITVCAVVYPLCAWGRVCSRAICMHVYVCMRIFIFGGASTKAHARTRALLHRLARRHARAPACRSRRGRGVGWWWWWLQ